MFSLFAMAQIQICNIGLHGRFKVGGANLLVSIIVLTVITELLQYFYYQSQVVSKLDNVLPSLEEREPQVTPVDSQTDLMQLNSYCIAMTCEDRDKLAAEVAKRCSHNPSQAPVMFKKGQSSDNFICLHLCLPLSSLPKLSHS